VKPIIGLSVQYNEECSRIDMSARYAIAVEKAGGIPMVLPEVTDERNAGEMCDICDGIIFTGGEDVDPGFYGEVKSEECARTSPHRDEFERKLFYAVTERKKPILGVCRGIQFLNSILGGKLYQHIPNHRGTTHKAAVYPGSVLYECAGSEVITVNSLHHQAIKKLADGLKITARSADGIIEAVTLPDYPFLLAVQWHPELLYALENDEVSGRIFKRYISECGRLRTQI